MTQFMECNLCSVKKIKGQGEGHKIINFHLIDLKFEQGLHFASLKQIAFEVKRSRSPKIVNLFKNFYLCHVENTEEK